MEASSLWRQTSNRGNFALLMDIPFSLDLQHGNDGLEVESIGINQAKLTIIRDNMRASRRIRDR